MYQVMCITNDVCKLYIYLNIFVKLPLAQEKCVCGLRGQKRL